MTERFNADEIFEIAEQIERNGAKFYRRAAQVAKTARPRELLLRLAEMEDSHERTFAEMHERISRENATWLSTFLDPDGTRETALYLGAVAAGRVFDLKADPASLLAEGESLPNILTKAIGLEKDSIVFYVGLKPAVPQSLGRDKLDQIVREEISHLTTLTSELAGLE